MKLNLCLQVKECKISSAYYNSLEDYVKETRRIGMKTDIKCLKGPIVVNVADIIDLIHKNHDLNLKNCKLEYSKSVKLDAYDADSDEINDSYNLNE